MTKNKELKDLSVGLKSLIFNIGDKEISLSLFEAKMLKDVLNDLFKEKVVHHNHKDLFDPNRVIGPGLIPEPTLPPWTITCTDNVGEIIINDIDFGEPIVSLGARGL